MMLERGISKAGEPLAFKSWWGQVYATEMSIWLNLYGCQGLGCCLEKGQKS